MPTLFFSESRFGRPCRSRCGPKSAAKYPRDAQVQPCLTSSLREFFSRCWIDSFLTVDGIAMCEQVRAICVQNESTNIYRMRNPQSRKICIVMLNYTFRHRRYFHLKQERRHARVHLRPLTL